MKKISLKKGIVYALLCAFVAAGVIFSLMTCKSGADTLELTGTITITPNTGVTTGTELTAVYSGNEPVTYQWKKGGKVIPGATLETYTPDEAGKYTVTVSASGYKSKTSSSVTVTGADLAGTITITPNTDVETGTELTAHYDGTEDVTISYQWKKNGAIISGATISTYIPEGAGSYTVTVSAPGYSSKTSAAVVVSSAANTLAGDVTITPNTGVGIGIALTAGYNGTEGVTISYQWKKNGAILPGATSPTYTPDAAGSYTVTVNAPGYNSKTSAAVVVIASNPGQPTNGTDSVVSIVQSSKAQASSLDYDDILALTRQAIYLAGGLDGIVKTGDTVVLKPNVIVTNFGWGSNNPIPTLVNGVCTDWRVIQAVAVIVREIVGPTGTILVMEGSGNGSSTANFANIGYTAQNLTAVDQIIALENEGTWAGPGDASGSTGFVTQVTLDGFAYKPPISTGKHGSAAGNYDDYHKADGKYWVNTKMLNADALICIPVVKQHWDAAVTGAIKNISIGAAPPSVYGLSANNGGRNGMVNHAAVDNFHGWIADYFRCLPADFVVMDGLQGLQNGPLPGGTDLDQHQKNLRCILASKDALAIDIVEANIMNWDYTSVPYFTTLAAKGQVGGKTNGRTIPLRGDPKDIVVLGNVKLDEVRTDFAGTMAPGMPGDKISTANRVKPTAAINYAVFSGSTLTLNLTLSNNVEKIDVYINGGYAASFNANMTSVALNASNLAAGGQHSIEVRAYTKFMYSHTETTTATKQ